MKFITVSISALFLTALCANATEQEYNLLPYQGRITNLLSRAPDNFIGLMAYEQNYLMETVSNRNYNDTTNMKRDEVKFQISLALPIWREIFGKNSVLAGSYTQRSWFQMTNFDQSSPFRETNYNPRLFLGWATQYNLPFGWTGVITVIINHVVGTDYMPAPRQLKVIGSSNLNPGGEFLSLKKTMTTPILKNIAVILI